MLLVLLSKAWLIGSSNSPHITKSWLCRQSKVWLTEPSEEFSTGTTPKEFSSVILVKIWLIAEQGTLSAELPKWSIAAS